jgi:hypothetical protein
MQLPQLPFLKRLDEVGFVGTRRALAALVLSIFFMLYLLVSLSVPQLAAALVALSGCYLVAFMAVVAEWFWARWFATGLGWSGVFVAIVSFVFNDFALDPALLIYGGLHALVVLSLMGQKMALRYDMQEGWRKRFGMDDFGVARLRKTVTRAAASLPSVILWALGPKQPGQGMLVVGAGLLTAVLAVAGLRGVIRMRSWGLLAMAASCALLVLQAGIPHAGFSAFSPGWFAALGVAPALGTAAWLPAALLGAALLPFARPALRFLRRAS